MKGSSKTAGKIKRRRVDDSISNSFAHKHKDSTANEGIEQKSLFTERHFWKLGETRDSYLF